MAFYCCNYSDNNRYHLGQRRVSGNCACVRFTVCYISLCGFSYKQQPSGPICSFHPEVSILSFGGFRSPGALRAICCSWLGCVSLLKLRSSTAVTGWMCSLQRWQATDLMRSRLVHSLRDTDTFQGSNCLVYCSAAKIDIQCQRWPRA